MSSWSASILAHGEFISRANRAELSRAVYRMLKMSLNEKYLGYRIEKYKKLIHGVFEHQALSKKHRSSTYIHEYFVSYNYCTIQRKGPNRRYDSGFYTQYTFCVEFSSCLPGLPDCL